VQDSHALQKKEVEIQRLALTMGWVLALVNKSILQTVFIFSLLKITIMKNQFLKSWLPWLPLLAYATFFISTHPLKNSLARKNLESSHPSSSANSVIVAETFYGTSKDGYILRISPTGIRRVSGGIGWRFFNAGFFKGDQTTSFRNNWWGRYIQGNLLGQSTTGGGSFFYHIRFDPTNPSPFYVILLLALVGWFWKRWQEVAKENALQPSAPSPHDEPDSLSSTNESS